MINDLKNKLFLIPIIIYISIIPLISRYVRFEIDQLEFSWINPINQVADTFIIGKVMVAIIIGVVALITIIKMIIKKEFKNNYLLFLVEGLLVLVILSYIFSEYKQVALFGYIVKFEGTLVFFSYLIVAIYTSQVINSRKDVNIIVKYSLFGLGLMIIIGWSQILDMNLLLTKIGRFLIAPIDYMDKIGFKNKPHQVFLTLSNPNFVGSYVVLVMMFWAQGIITLKNKMRMFLSILGFLSMALILAFSGSRAGFIGGLVALLVWNLILFYKDRLKIKGINIKAVLVLIVFVLIFNFTGVNYSRVKKIVSKEEVDRIPLTDMYTVDNELIVTYDTNDYLINKDLNQYNMYEIKGFNKETFSYEETQLMDQPPMIFESSPIKKKDEYNGFVLWFQDKRIFRFTFVDGVYKYFNSKKEFKNIDSTFKTGDSLLSNVNQIDEDLFFQYNNKDYLVKSNHGKFSLWKVENFNLNTLTYSNIRLIEASKEFVFRNITIEKENQYAGFFLWFKAKNIFRFAVVNNEMKYLNPTGNFVRLEKVDQIELDPYLSMGTGRVYIWSRAIPLVKDTLLIGHGTDTFVFYFPQTDYVGKFMGLGNSKRISNTIVDKPHNLYVQYAVNTGLISLIIYLILNFAILVELFKIIKRKVKTDYEIILFSTLIGYGFTALFNDSTPVVSTIYWGLVGISIALIMIDKKNRKEKRSLHG